MSRKTNHCKQLVSIEIERRAVMELCAAVANFIVQAEDNGWACGDLNRMCAATIDKCAVRIKKLRKVVRMNYDRIASRRCEIGQGAV